MSKCLWCDGEIQRGFYCSDCDKDLKVLARSMRDWDGK